MLTNLLETASSTTTRAIRPGAGRNGGRRAVVTVADNGVGIAPEDQQRVFERFYRVDKSRSKQTGGTGLGLSIVKHGAQVHHAQIAMQSALGEGTTITLTFPAQSSGKK
ncbi:MAG: sensor histidine kinase [Christensenellales bacterium]